MLAEIAGAGLSVADWLRNLACTDPGVRLVQGDHDVLSYAAKLIDAAYSPAEQTHRATPLRRRDDV
jgi:hypothetical protein